MIGHAPTPPSPRWLGRARRDPLWRLLFALGLLSAFAVAMVLFRAAWTGRVTYRFLYWNLFLAWVPVGAALLAHGLAAARRPPWLVALPLLAWLAFFPNAPYILTDLMHLRTTGGAPLWLDVLQVGTVALAGLLTCLGPLRLAHGVVTRLTRASLAGWLFAGLSCLGAGFGVYLGRFERWNSWDIVTRPGDVLVNALESLTVDRALAFSLLFGALLFLVYLVLTALGGAPTPHGDGLAAPAPPTE